MKIGKIKSFLNSKKYKYGFGEKNKIKYKSNNGCAVFVFDTSISSSNIGDEIINESTNKILCEIFESARLYKGPTHCGINGRGISLANTANLRIVSGTNLLDKNLGLGGGSWSISPIDILRISPVLLFGVGWSEYSKPNNLINNFLFRKLFEKEISHSVRDSYTKSRMNEIGFHNTINTSCPTTWSLTPNHCKMVPKDKGKNVVFTLTDYDKNTNYDRKLIKVLMENYESIYFFPQGKNDLEYFHSFKTTGINIIPQNLNAYTKILNEINDIDYIGTRLHAGIKALQLKRRTIIISIDNRAKEIAKDINLTTTERNDSIEQLQKLINSKWETKLNIPLHEIQKWKNQFK